MKVVVTGGSGQLGTLVLERLAANRKVKQVVSLDQMPPRVPSPKIEYRIVDLRDPGLERHLEGAEALIHLAFIVTRRASAEEMRAVNVDGSRRIFEAAVAHDIRKVVYASSIAAYGVVGGQPVPIVESTPRQRTPALTYADNKYEVEAYLDELEREHPGVSVTRMRPGILLGRRVAHVSETLIRRRLMPVVSNVRAPIVWDEDVADAFILALFSDAGGAYNLVASEPLPAEEVARLAEFRVLHVPQGAAGALEKAAALVRHERDASWFEAGDVEMIVSPERAHTVLGWKPRYPTAFDVAVAFGKQARARRDPRIALFMSVVQRLQKRQRQAGEMPREAQLMKMRIHLDVTGPRGDDFDLFVDQSALTIRRGIPRPADAVVQVSAETFLSMLGGQIDPSEASTSGRLRIRGEPLAGLVVSWIISGFRRATERPGASGRVARRLARWFERGASR